MLPTREPLWSTLEQPGKGAVVLARLVPALMACLLAVAACGDAEEVLPPPATAEAPPAGQAPGEDAAAVERRMERAIFDLVNAERRQRGLTELEWDDQLAELAREWSRRMADRGQLEHQDAERMLERSDGFVAVGENIFRATGGAPASTIHVGWMRSDGHRANVLREGFDRLGVAVVCAGDGHVWATQRFGRTAVAGRPGRDRDIPPEQPIVAEPGQGPVCPGSPTTGELQLEGLRWL